VLIIVENLPVPLDRRVWMEATTLSAAGYRVSVICPTGSGYDALRETLDGIAIYRHPLPPEQSSVLGYLREYSAALWSQWRLARRVYRERGFEVIHACNPPDLIFLVAAWFRLFRGTRFMFDHHDLCPELFESKFGRRGVFHGLLRVVERLTFLSADTVISTNTSYKTIAVTRGKCRESDVFVVRSGPNVEKFKRVPPHDAYRHGRKFLVGYLGVMGEFDGVEHLLHAARCLIAKGRTDIHFCLIGDGPMRSRLQTITEELGITEYAEFTGRVPDDELLQRLSTCDVCVDPDPMNPLNDKSTMNKILEYMALERPIVQYDLFEGRQSAGDASAYATPNDPEDLARHIEALLDDAPARLRMGAEGRRRMEELLGWRHQAPNLLAAYEHALSGRKPHAQP
jgi:glycosyltransferase involved in cell wall biosynthesis